MGCKLSRAASEEQWGEKCLSPKATAPPPPPLTIEDFDCSSRVTRSYPAVTVLAGLGASSAANAADAACEALAGATKSLAAAVGAGHSPKPSIAIVASSKAATEAEEVRCPLVRALPGALLHGATSVASLFATCNKSPGTDGGWRSSEKAEDAVECLLLEAPDGSFAAAWDDTGDALYAAKWLQELMPDVQAIIMAAVPGQEESALCAVQSVFPGISVYGSSVSKATNWVTMSHLGSAEHGISLVGIGMRVSFGAAEMVPRDNADLSASLTEVYDAAMAAGSLKTATAGILTCRGCLVDISKAEKFGQEMSKIPILGLACHDQTHSLTHSPSIGIMLFGERHPTQEQESVQTPAKIKRNADEDDAMSASTSWPHSPFTSLSESPTESREGGDVGLLEFDSH